MLLTGCPQQPLRRVHHLHLDSGGQTTCPSRKRTAAEWHIQDIPGALMTTQDGQTHPEDPSGNQGVNDSGMGSKGHGL